MNNIYNIVCIGLTTAILLALLNIFSLGIEVKSKCERLNDNVATTWQKLKQLEETILKTRRLK